MSTATLVAVLFALVTCTQTLQKVDIAFVLDGSRSIVPAEFDFGKSWVGTTVREMRKKYGSLARFAVLQYSSKDRFEIPIGFNDCYRESKDIGKDVDGMLQLRDESFIGTGLARLVNFTFPDSDLYLSSLKFVIIISDGRIGDSHLLEGWKETADALGVTVYGLGISDYSLPELKKITGSDDVASFFDATKRKKYIEDVEAYILESELAQSVKNLDFDNRVRVCEAGSSVEKYPDTSYTASTFKTDKDPSQARLYALGAWISKKSRLGEYLQLDLGTSKPVGGVIIKGIQLGSSKKYVKKFILEYAKVPSKFEVVKGADGVAKHFKGNVNAADIVVVTLDKSIDGRYVRIKPLEWNNEIALKFAVLRGDCRTFF